MANFGSRLRALKADVNSLAEGDYTDPEFVDNLADADTRVNQMLGSLYSDSNVQSADMEEKARLGSELNDVLELVDSIKEAYRDHLGISRNELESYLHPPEEVDDDDEDYEVVLYVTSETADRRTRKNCQAVKQLLTAYDTSFLEVDVSTLGRVEREALFEETGETELPQLFVKGVFVGTFDDVHELNEAGLLETRLSGVVVSPADLVVDPFDYPPPVDYTRPETLEKNAAAARTAGKFKKPVYAALPSQ